MAGLFKWPERGPVVDTSGLGAAVIAMPLPAGAAVPPGCAAVLVDRGGRTRRAPDGARLAPEPGETAWAFHPGPYHADLAPFAQAPEIGLRVAFAIDSPDPRVAQQRFDLYLASEAADAVPLDRFCEAIQAALRHELSQGHLELPPCTTLAEWNAFRAGFNQLLYMRFGVTVEECVPADLGETVDFAQILLARRESAPESASAVAPAAAPEPLSDARALRRLFLELPCVMCGLRLAVLPSGAGLFRRHQELLQRLDLANLSAATMPALELAAPGVPLDACQQARRIRQVRRAVAALDEAWALLARLQPGGDAQMAGLFDEAERIVANLEYHTGERRLALSESEPA
ncbi:hypothetical protein Q4S45_07370 [Massilia sp. R2A-15]|uniref:hypothetical protein n=1 Tax=Massilia sp. R2A-15 TaxID=3064278 RepID=UPI002733342D|nr:hypothetical protein [Massilia sp. R2A-15]WLI90928.1 hypothetical protein Q4S45_07370 [Massilia sp. R2A-15]